MDAKKYSLGKQRSGIWRSLREDGDFEEEEVWEVIKENNNNNEEKGSSPLPLPRSRGTHTSAARMIPTRDVSSSSSASSSHEPKMSLLQQSSAPLNIPDWSKIYNNKQNTKKVNAASKFGGDFFDSSHSFDEDHYGGGDSFDDEEEEDDDDDECELYDTNLPPHEIIARRLARSQISSFSVFEGVGRTLKGRDLSKVRNAVLTKTGFLESL